MKTIIVTTSTYKINSGSETSFEIEDEEWDNMSEQEQVSMCWEYAQTLVHWDFQVIPE